MIRLRSKGSLAANDLAQAVLAIGTIAEPPDQAQAQIHATVGELRRRGFVAPGALRTTPAGNQAVCDALGVRRKPTWDQFCQRLAARALDLAPASEPAKQIFQHKEAVALAVLRQRVPLPPGHTLNAVGDALIREAFGLPAGKITVAAIRTSAVMRRIGAGTAGDPLAAAATMASARSADKKAMIHALARRAFDRELAPRQVEAAPPARPRSDDRLLSLVHDAFPHVGSKGRVGTEKVFISALWHQLASDRRASDLSLDHFKRWLVRANRDHLVALERADAVGAMDPRLVAESEIATLGTTFHFVLDPSTRTQGARL